MIILRNRGLNTLPFGHEDYFVLSLVMVI